jgi:translocator protein
VEELVLTGRGGSADSSARAWLVLAAFLGASFVVATLGSTFTAAGMPDWYMSLEKPAFNPPSWVFGPVWTTLYVMMAVAAWLVWRASGFHGARTALVWYFIQLGLNLTWSAIFFALQSPGWALVEIVALWTAILITTVLFFRHSRVAGWLMIPYLLWVTFAGILNAAIWQLN